jgi:hypothetical protein
LWVLGEILAANILSVVDWLLPCAAHSLARAPRRIFEEQMTSVVALGAGFRNVLIACSSAEAELNELVAVVCAGTTPLEALQASTRECR